MNVGLRRSVDEAVFRRGHHGGSGDNILLGGIWAHFGHVQFVGKIALDNRATLCVINRSHLPILTPCSNYHERLSHSGFMYNDTLQHLSIVEAIF